MFGMTLARSNVPHAEKSAMMKWYDKVSGNGTLTQARDVAKETGAVLRQGTESLVVGGILGALHAESKTGLNISIPIGTKTVVVPADLALGLAGIGAAVACAGHEAATDLRNAGSAGLTVYGFRKGYDLIAEMNRSKGIPVAQFAGEGMKTGAVAEDRILVTARTL